GAHMTATDMARASRKGDGQDSWPSLEGGTDTAKTLLLWGQIVGKTRLALSPPVNHWWHVPFYVSARGLGTSAIPARERAFDIEFDFIDHRLVLRASDGAMESIDLRDQPLSGFYSEYLDRLARLGINVRFYPFTVEMSERIRLDQDDRRCRYDPDWAHRFF